MRSHNFRRLVGKEWHELLASRAYWLFLLMTGPLLGHSFITAVNLYAEASGIGGGPAALSQGLSPLDGILVPTFGAYDLAVTLLFPFVAIRLVASEKESGSLKLLLQFPARLGTLLAAKGIVLLGGGLLAWAPGLLALGLWKIYGGHLYGPETANLLLGHLLHMALSAGVAVAAAALADGAASAAIVTLGFTLGTWALDFIAAGRGGVLQKLAAYTPVSALRIFEQGQLRLSVVIVILLFTLGGFIMAALWLHTGRPLRTRGLGAAALALAVALMTAGAASVRMSWDLSENRRNSFSPAEEAALKRIRRPLHVTVFLAPEDPRLMDLERSILSKLQRILPSVQINYGSRSRSGLFEGSQDRYGEIWYEMTGRTVMSRSTTEAIVLELIYQLAEISPPAHVEEAGYTGYPLAARPAGAAWIFYGIWPLLMGMAWWRTLN